jgi:hypothetical protein
MRASICLFAVALAAVAAGCTSGAEKTKAVVESPVAVKSKTDDRADFGAYKTWSWVKLQPGAQIDPRLDDPEIKDMITDAVDREMFQHGYQRVGMDESPDLIMSVHVALNDIDDQYIQEHYNGQYYPEYKTQIGGQKLADQWTEGSMMIILFDAKTREAVWGAGGQAEVFPDLAPDVRRQRINKIASLLLASLPSRK